MSEEEILRETATSSVKLIRGQKGNYGWEIKCYNPDLGTALEKVGEVNQKMKEKYFETS